MVKVELLLLAMSPCCKTFSKADSSNVTRGHNYRLHGEENPDRPPRDSHSEKGIEAIEADDMVMCGIDFAIWMVNSQPIPGQGAAFYMENPVGSLWRRPYMRIWEETGMHGDEARGALLCLRPLLPQAHSHLDEHGVDTDRQYGHRVVRVQVQGGEAGAGTLGAPVQDRSGELAGKRRPRQEGSQEYDAREAASRTIGDSNHAQRKRCRQEGGAGGGVQGGELEAEEAEDEVDWQGEFEPGIS